MSRTISALDASGLIPVSELSHAINADVHWGVVVVLLLFAFVILATIWMVTR